MQFNLSTLLLVAPAVAFGCTGWKLARWMIEQDGASMEPLFYTQLVSCLLLLIALAVVGGRKVAAWGAGGYVLNILIVLCLFGPPPSDDVWVVPLIGGPFGLLIGSLRFAREATRPLLARHGFLLPACVMAGWMLAFLVGAE
jgi:hypothetical protein